LAHEIAGVDDPLPRRHICVSRLLMLHELARARFVPTDVTAPLCPDGKIYSQNAGHLFVVGQ
jgi:hypothetical protein